ncbi:hypothetical protein [Bacillus aquiflavi]|uniref:hypothetical protein n=1 Tax=Bacillus aquiflavi TaxID=2672567 RepID=UPI00292FF801|nr:hypothetical protein [Bacillus aquiflavi]
MGNLARKLEQDHQRSTQVQTTAVVKKQRFTLGEKILALIFGAAVFIGATQMISYQASIYEINKEIQQIENIN